eukprot:CAMPEP_0177700002 /NCGR_PEP_ID=MMETSP0484_2-20121128/5873_1 /TAXON_ID=354590 /ORGANISM="Rhodomonas lens, Strain RHODO" /LENGTH=112 /DNA_ID=CAMNT_0019211195 /DNA_START=160 /DNA_END=495 /DNA_ORIENTATION=-
MSGDGGGARESDWQEVNTVVGASDKQVGFAQRLASQQNVPIPPGLFDSKAETSEFITTLLNSVPPTAKQLALAQRLATEQKIEVPANAKASKPAMTEWLSLLMSGGAGAGAG